MQEVIALVTSKREELIDITGQVRSFVEKVSIKVGVLNVYTQGATSAIMIQENWDESVQEDVLDYLRKQIPKGVWKHDAQDGNADAHIKAGLIGPSETIPIVKGRLALGRWQNIFLCEFDGPRKDRKIVLTILSFR